MTTDTAITESADFQLPIHNWEALEQIRKEKNLLSGVALAAGTAGATLGTFANPAGFLLFAAAYSPLARVQKLARLEIVASLLLDKFSDQGIQIFPALKTDGKNPIDLFIRFPKRTHIIISIRSKGDNEIVYNQAKEIVQVKKGAGSGLSTWKPCPLVELADYERWIAKNRSVFAMTSREATKTPTAKALALWKPTRIASSHKSELYSEIGTTAALALRRKGTAFVISEEQIYDFVSNWLARYS